LLGDDSDKVDITALTAALLADMHENNHAASNHSNHNDGSSDFNTKSEWWVKRRK